MRREVSDPAPTASDPVARDLDPEVPVVDSELPGLPPSLDPGGSAFEPGAAAFTPLRIGPYRLLEQIGWGGMGEVYRAVRADAEYEQEVAIKLVHGNATPRRTSERLRAERQILADLAHPNIARLLDGGTTAAGVTYLVMELVRGMPIDEYCAAHALSLEARLALFLKVCSAVQYAHQHMVIHRDLKPANILVTGDGAPKLLDFGIARIIAPEAGAQPSEATQELQRILTPSYASPEQLLGERVTAASDVYCLGLILYELLTGGRASTQRDYRARLRELLAGDPPRPSLAVRGRGLPGGARAERALRRRLRGDLDTITMMALRRDPQRRYATVDQLSADIGRYLARRPVRARRETLAYRGARLLARHRIGSAGVAAAAVALIAAVVVSMHEARIAQAQRERAEQRYEDVRRLANSLIFDIHDSIRYLPGAQASRHLLVDTAVRYLDGLLRDSGEDPSLKRELAAGYERLGDVQGQALEANEGDPSGAIASYERALQLRLAVLRAEPQDLRTRRDSIVVSGKLSDLLWSVGDGGGALAHAARTLQASEALAVDQHDAPTQRLQAASSLDYGYKLAQIRGDYTAALPQLRRAVATLERLAAAAPQDQRLERTLALAELRSGQVLARDPAGRAEALERNAAAERLLAALASADPTNADYAHLLAFTEHERAQLLVGQGLISVATDYESRALSRSLVLEQADPISGEYHFAVATMLAGLARIELAAGHAPAALERLSAALERIEPLSSPPHRNVYFRAELASEREQLGAVHLRLAADAAGDERAHLLQAALADYRQALALDTTLAPSWSQSAAALPRLRQQIAHCQSALEHPT